MAKWFTWQKAWPSADQGWRPPRSAFMVGQMATQSNGGPPWFVQSRGYWSPYPGVGLALIETNGPTSAGGMYQAPCLLVQGASFANEIHVFSDGAFRLVVGSNDFYAVPEGQFRRAQSDVEFFDPEILGYPASVSETDSKEIRTQQHNLFSVVPNTYDYPEGATSGSCYVWTFGWNLFEPGGPIWFRMRIWFNHNNGIRAGKWAAWSNHIFPFPPLDDLTDAQEIELISSAQGLGFHVDTDRKIFATD